MTGFRARPGYDLASGVGTISAPAFVAQLVAAARARAAAARSGPSGGLPSRRKSRRK